MSVDVEDYFQVGLFENVIARGDWDEFELRVERNTHALLDLFDVHGVTATFFVLGWVAERCPDLVRSIVERRHELAAHGYDHRRVTSQTPSEVRSDVRRTKRILEEIAEAEVIGYRAPSYSIVRDTLWALDILVEEGFLYDSSIFPIVHDYYGMPDAPRFPWQIESKSGGSLHEFPISTVRIGGRNLPFVGGGYLRHFPTPWIRWGMRRLNGREGRPALVYIHPWEIDPGQPRQDVRLLTRIRHYRNLRAAKNKLASLLERFHFAPVREVLGI